MDSQTPGSDPSNAAEPNERATEAGAADGLLGFRRYTYSSIVGGAFVMLVLPAIVGPVPYPPHPLGIVEFLGVLIVLAAVTRLTERHVPRNPAKAPPSAREWRVWAVVGGVASLPVAAVSVAVGDDLLWSFAPAIIASLVVASLPRRSRGRAIAAAIGVVALLGLVSSLVRGDEPVAPLPVSGVLVTGFVFFMTLVSIWTWDVAAQLDAARRRAASLAVANERLRFAAELHDIQGHHLQVIALKSELAHRLLRTDPDAAGHEISAVQQLAADALRDTRAVVHGYRRATLDAELANASSVLASAGIDPRLHVDEGLRTDELPETCRHLLGLALREAVTNILRHSSATRAEVTLTGDALIRLSVLNDGARPGETAPDGGLGDLAERLQAAGGVLSWQQRGDRFEVRAELPADPASAPGVTPGSRPGSATGSRP